ILQFEGTHPVSCLNAYCNRKFIPPFSKHAVAYSSDIRLNGLFNFPSRKPELSNPFAIKYDILFGPPLFSVGTDSVNFRYVFNAAPDIICKFVRGFNIVASQLNLHSFVSTGTKNHSQDPQSRLSLDTERAAGTGPFHLTPSLICQVIRTDRPSGCIDKSQLHLDRKSVVYVRLRR